MKKKTFAIAFSVALLAGILSLGYSIFGSNDSTEAKASPQIVVGLQGTGLMYIADVPGFPDSMCFDVDLVDLSTNKVIGDATDCLSDVNGDGDGLILVGTTTFNFPGGQLVSRGLTTVHPLGHGLNGFTHATAAPAPLAGTNILSGTGPFAGADGTVRLSGLVDLTDFEKFLEFWTHLLAL